MSKFYSARNKSRGIKTPRDYTLPAYVETIALNLAVTRLFFKNNKYMLRKRGISIYAQVKSMRSEGLLIDYSNLKKFCNKGINSISITYLNFFCRYWNNTLLDMISHDLEEYDQRLASSV